MARARQQYPLCILLELNLPGQSGLDILSELGEDYLAPAIMISGYESIDISLQALKSGAADFIEKPLRGNELIYRIKWAIAKIETDRNRTAARPDINSANLAGWRVLTRREQEIFHELLSGGSTKDLAQRLGLSHRTVEDHRSNIMKKARVKTTAQLLLSVLRPGLDATYLAS